MKRKKLLTIFASIFIAMLVLITCKKDNFVELVGVCPPTEFTIRLSSNPLLGGTTIGNGTFSRDTLTTVSATPNHGFRFTNWTDSISNFTVSASPSYTFKLDTNKIFVANFVPAENFTVGLSSIPSAGGTTTGNGSFFAGDSVIIGATPNNGYTFTNWTNGTEIASTKPNYKFKLTKDTTFVANFAIVAGNLTVGLSSNPLAGGTITGGGSFVPNTPVTIVATPNDGYTFTNWTNGTEIASTTPSYTFTLTKDTTFVANFAPVAGNFTVDLSSIPPAGGTITGGGSFVPNTPVTIVATPNDGYTFTNWTNGAGIASITPTLTFTLTKDTTFVANFAPIVIGGNCPPVIDLGLAGNFTIFAESGISSTSTGLKKITGDIGVNPVKAIGITGFNLDLPAAGAFSTSALVDGKVYAPDYYPPTPAYVVTTTTDMEAAYTTAYNLTTPAPVITTGDISGLTLTKGIYKTGTGLLITAAGVTLDGGGDDCATFIFQVAGGLTVANAATIHLINGAHAKNIFWVVAGTTALGTTVEFNGNILCKTGIAVLSGAKITGRLLAQTAVTLDGVWVVIPQ